MSEAKRSLEPAAQHEAADELDADGKRGRRRSKTMSRKEIARELRRQRAFGRLERVGGAVATVAAELAGAG